MHTFKKGLTLCEQFFLEEAKPILDECFPSLSYSAGLLGYGSDVLGYDDVVSADHMWGPRFYLFLKKEDLSLRPAVEEAFATRLPYTYQGYSVNFSEPDKEDGGVRHPVPITEGPVSPLIFIDTIEDFLTEYLGMADLFHLDALDWLSFSEHRLLSLSLGKLFHDDLGFSDLLGQIRFYPEDVKLYLLASNWAILAEEQAFVKRCGQVGDDLGSRIITARMVNRLMRLCFLYENTYAPYSKWYGTAFSRLNIDPQIRSFLQKALTENNLRHREEALVWAQLLVGQLHNSKKITEPLELHIQQYFGRDIKVIYAERFAEKIMQKLSGTRFESFPLVGSLSHVGNLDILADSPEYARRIKGIYENPNF